MTVYISSAITNNPIYKMQFGDMQRKLERDGHEVVNQALFTLKANWGFDEIMDFCLRALDSADAIVMFGDWKDSRGANRELGYALGKGIKVYYEYGGNFIEHEKYD